MSLDSIDVGPLDALSNVSHRDEHYSVLITLRDLSQFRHVAIMASLGSLTRRAGTGAFQTNCWRPLPSFLGQYCGVSTSSATSQAQPQIDTADSSECTSDERAPHGNVELAVIRNDWR